MFHSRCKNQAEGGATPTVRRRQWFIIHQKQVDMNINGIGSPALSALLNTNTTQTSNTPSSVPPTGSGAATSNISKPAELLQKLQQLQQQDPAQFKQVLSQLADALQQVADGSGQSNNFATKLAAAFKNASDTGDLSALQSALQPTARMPLPQNAGSTAGQSQGAQGHHHGHHHHGGGGAIAAAFSTAISSIDAILNGSSPVGSTNTAASTTSP